MNIWWNFMMEEEIEYLREYLKLIQETVIKNNEAFKQRELEMKAAGVKPFEIDASGDTYDPYDALYDDAYRSSEMEQLMLRTLTIGVFIFLEYSLNYVCAKLEREHKLIFSYKDLRDSGVIRAIKYLEKVLDTDFPADEKLKKEFDIARIIRNSLVHSNAVINENDLNKISPYIKENPDLLSINELRKIKLTDKYANELINLSSRICDDLGKCMESE